MGGKAYVRVEGALFLILSSSPFGYHVPHRIRILSVADFKKRTAQKIPGIWTDTRTKLVNRLKIPACAALSGHLERPQCRASCREEEEANGQGGYQDEAMESTSGNPPGPPVNTDCWDLYVWIHSSNDEHCNQIKEPSTPASANINAAPELKAGHSPHQVRVHVFQGLHHFGHLMKCLLCPLGVGSKDQVWLPACLWIRHHRLSILQFFTI
eukprot:1158333-Pelagomonas_calceolata.AAC.9